MTVESDVDQEVADKEPIDQDEDVEVEGQGDEDEDDGPQSVEDLARSLGWKSAKEWKGNPPPDGLLKPAEYVARRLDGADRSRKEVKALRDQVLSLQTNHIKSVERARAQVEARYRAERAALVKEGDVEGIDALDEARNNALASLKTDVPQKSEQMEVEEVVEAIQDNPLAQRFFKANDWLLEDGDPESVDMFNWAGRRAEELQRQGCPESMKYRIIERELRSAFPDRYSQVEMERDPKTGQFVQQRSLARDPPVTATPGRGGRGSGAYASKLTAEEIKIADDDIKDGLFKNREEYARALFRNRGENVR